VINGTVRIQRRACIDRRGRQSPPIPPSLPPSLPPFLPSCLWIGHHGSRVRVRVQDLTELGIGHHHLRPTCAEEPEGGREGGREGKKAIGMIRPLTIRATFRKGPTVAARDLIFFLLPSPPPFLPPSLNSLSPALERLDCPSYFASSDASLGCSWTAKPAPSPQGRLATAGGRKGRREGGREGRNEESGGKARPWRGLPDTSRAFIPAIH